MIRPLAALCLLAAACSTPPEFLPPPFGPGGPAPTRFFYPTALSVLPDGSLLVINGNFNHAFDGGTLVTVRKSYLDAFFAKGLQCDTATPAPECDDDVRSSRVQAEVFGGAVMIGNYAGSIALDPAGTRAFVAARDTAHLDAVDIHPDLSLTCAPGSGTTPDCRDGSVDLTPTGVIGPFALASGEFLDNGQSHPAVFVASMVPRIESISGGDAITDSQVAAVDMANPSQVLFTMPSGLPTDSSFGYAPGPMLFDAAGRRLILSGCFKRFVVGGSGEPGTGPCNGVPVANNLLRFLSVDAQSSAAPQFVDLFADVNSLDTTALALGAPDPVTQAPATLWATMRNPDQLVEIALPKGPSVAPRVRRTIPLPVSPANLVRIPRPGGADLIAVAAENVGAVVIYDSGAQQVVGEVEHLGDQPFDLKLLSSDGVSARLATTVFRSCSVGLIEVPLDQPWNAALRGRAGVCP